MPGPLQIFTFIIGSAVVIFGAYFVTYWVAKGSQKVYKGRSIQVLDRFSLSKDKCIALLCVYDKVYVVAFSSGAISLLDTLDSQTAERLTAQTGPTLPLGLEQGFSAAWGKFTRKLPLRKASAEEETFSLKKIPFEAYLQQEIHNDRQDAANNPSSKDAISTMIKTACREKEGQHNDFLDNAYFEEDILK